MKIRLIVLLLALIISLVLMGFLMATANQFEKLVAQNQEYYETILELNELGKLAEDMLREAELKIKTYEAILEGKIRVEIKSIPNREY